MYDAILASVVAIISVWCLVAYPKRAKPWVGDRLSYDSKMLVYKKRVHRLVTNKRSLHKTISKLKNHIERKNMRITALEALVRDHVSLQSLSTIHEE